MWLKTTSHLEIVSIQFPSGFFVYKNKELLFAAFPTIDSDNPYSF